MLQEPKYFKVLRQIESERVNFTELAQTEHFNTERSARHNKIVDILGVPTKSWTFVVDKDHPNGNEVHTVFNNGVILIRNQRTNKVITELIARPAQIKRYWDNLNIPISREIFSLCSLAMYHQNHGFNDW